MFTYKKLKGILLLEIFISIASLKCNYFTEPEPYYNKNAGSTPPVPGTDITHFKQGQHVGGTITFTYLPKLHEKAIIKEELMYVDSIPLEPIEGSLATFRLDTKKWSESLHKIRIDVWFTYNDLGIDANSRNQPSASYITTLVFDQTPPIAPRHLTVTKVNNYPRISWQSTPFPTFYSYVIERNGVPIDTTYSVEDSSYDDTEYSLTDFDRVLYSVNVSNGGEEVTSNCTLQFGQTLSLDYRTVGVSSGISSSVVLETFPPLGTNKPNYIVTASTETGKKLKSGEFPLYSSFAHSLSLDGKRFQTLLGGHLFIYDLSTMVIKLGLYYLTAPLGSIYGYALGEDDRSYYSDGNGNLYILDNHGNYLVKYHLFNGPAIFISISPDTLKKMIAVDKDGIKNFKIAGDSVLPSTQSETINGINSAQADWVHSKIFICKSNAIVESWDTNTLKLIRTFQPSAELTSAQVTAIYAKTEDIFIARTVSQDKNSISILTQYKIDSGSERGSSSFPEVIQSLLGTPEGRFIFACTASEQWIIDTSGELP